MADEGDFNFVPRPRFPAAPPTPIEAARTIGRVFTLAARDVGVALDWSRYRDGGDGNESDLRANIDAIIMAAQGGKLNPGLYFCVWELRRLLFGGRVTAH